MWAREPGANDVAASRADGPGKLGPGEPVPSILTWHGLNCDHDGSRSRVRPFHCTSVRLTSAITTNVGDSSA